MAENKSEAREVLIAFVTSLTGAGRNRENTLTINHDELIAAIKDAKRVLATPGAA